jgi:hypothetical protein
MAKNRRSKGGSPPKLGPYLTGEEPVAEDGTDELTLERVREAMNDLSLRHQRFFELDMICEEPESQIEIGMGLAPGSFETFKREAMTALREALLKQCK